MRGKIIAFGAYDLRKPRVRLLLDAIRRAGALEREIHIAGWNKVAQTNVPSKLAFLGVLLRMAFAYPGALWRLIRSPRHATILLPYPGIVEIFLIAPLAWVMRRTLVLDAFLPIYDTIVIDRGLAKPGGLIAAMIWRFERLALRLADIVLVDTDSHGEYFACEFGIDSARFHTVLVGAEEQFFSQSAHGSVDDLLGPEDGRPIVLFYGQLIPLHGVPTILEAAKIYDGPEARWVVIGLGQLEPLLREATAEPESSPVEWIEWVEYERLPAVIARADVCLGVFGASDKAARVIPNKLFQQLAVGKPVITRESPAVDGLAARFPNILRTVPANDPRALANVVKSALIKGSELLPLPAISLAELSPDAGVLRLLKRLDDQAAT
ncbi:MAG: glycosyltransferase [Pseudomonadota bacterium]